MIQVAQLCHPDAGAATVATTARRALDAAGRAEDAVGSGAAGGGGRALPDRQKMLHSP